MKHSKLLLLPALFALTSCVSFSQGAPGGSIYDPTSQPGQSGTSETFDYYPEGSFGDAIPEVSQLSRVATLDFSNNESGSNKKYENGQDLLADCHGSVEKINTIDVENVWQGVYGLKLDYRPGVKNNLTIHLKDLTFRYVEINCSPAFYNILDHDSGKVEYVSGDSVLKAAGIEKAVILPNEKDMVEDKAVTRNVTFDFITGQNDLSLQCFEYSLVINHITFFN